MREKLINHKAKKVIGKYDDYVDFSKNASKSEKKIVFESTIFEANKIQRRAAGIK